LLASSLLGFEFGVDFDVNIKQVLERLGSQQLLRAIPLPPDSQQAELLAPVAEVVDPDNVPPLALVEVGDEGTDDGAAEVAGVELLGNVGGGEFNDGFLSFLLRGRGGFAVGGLALVDVGED
jgi:hypothetical protein